MTAHDTFATVATSPSVFGWKGYSWRACCKACGWTGPARSHPLDCGEDSIDHTDESRAREPEAASPTEGMRP